MAEMFNSGIAFDFEEVKAARQEIVKLTRSLNKNVNEAKKATSQADKLTDKTENLTKKVKENNKALKSGTGAMSSFNSSMRMGVGSISAMSGGIGLLAIGVVGVGVGVGVGKVILDAAQHSKELNRQLQVGAEQSNMSVRGFQNMALAVSTVGINIDKLGDMLGDTEEKIGDFINTGGGGFQDFADAMGYSKKEARAVALELQKLSGRDVLVEMVSRMEDANVSSEQMSHALEGMANDARILKPLLADNAKELKGLEGRFDGVATKLNDKTNKQLYTAATQFGLLGNNVSNFVTQESSGLISLLGDMAEGLAGVFAEMMKINGLKRNSYIMDLDKDIRELGKANSMIQSQMEQIGKGKQQGYSGGGFSSDYAPLSDAEQKQKAALQAQFDANEKERQRLAKEREDIFSGKMAIPGMDNGSSSGGLGSGGSMPTVDLYAKAEGIAARAAYDEMLIDLDQFEQRKLAIKTKTNEDIKLLEEALSQATAEGDLKKQKELKTAISNLNKVQADEIKQINVEKDDWISKNKLRVEAEAHAESIRLAREAAKKKREAEMAEATLESGTEAYIKNDPSTNSVQKQVLLDQFAEEQRIRDEADQLHKASMILQLQGEFELSTKYANMAVELEKNKQDRLNQVRQDSLASQAGYTSQYDGMITQMQAQGELLSDSFEQIMKDQTLTFENTQSMAMGLSSVSEMMLSQMDKDSKASKPLAIMQATMDAYVSMNRAIKEGGPIAGPIMAGVIGGIAFANIREIEKAKDGASMVGYAGGTSNVMGPGTSKSDDIPAMLSRGESVLTTSASESLGRANIDAINRGHMPNFGGGSNVMVEAPLIINGNVDQKTMDGLSVAQQKQVEKIAASVTRKVTHQENKAGGQFKKYGRR